MRTYSTPNYAFSSCRSRRTHSAEFKSQVIAECRVAGVSKATVAMAHGINANLARRWVVEADGASITSVPKVAPPPTPAFVPVQMPSPAQAPVDIRLEVRRGPVSISVSWPCSAAAECGAWLREFLR